MWKTIIACWKYWNGGLWRILWYKITTNLLALLSWVEEKPVDQISPKGKVKYSLVSCLELNEQFGAHAATEFNTTVMWPDHVMRITGQLTNILLTTLSLVGLSTTRVNAAHSYLFKVIIHWSCSSLYYWLYCEHCLHLVESIKWRLSKVFI